MDHDHNPQQVVIHQVDPGQFAALLHLGYMILAAITKAQGTDTTKIVELTSKLKASGDALKSVVSAAQNQQ